MEPDECWRPTVSVLPSPVPLVKPVQPDSAECQPTAHKHSTSVQRPSPRKLSLLNSCVIAGLLPGGAWRWGGVDQVGGVVNKGEALLRDEHCNTDKGVQGREGPLFTFFIGHTTAEENSPYFGSDVLFTL